MKRLLLLGIILLIVPSCAWFTSSKDYEECKKIIVDWEKWSDRAIQIIDSLQIKLEMKEIEIDSLKENLKKYEDWDELFEHLSARLIKKCMTIKDGYPYAYCIIHVDELKYKCELYYDDN